MPDAPNPLAELLRSEIARRGPISFREFMAQALYHPVHGYYGSGRARIGRGGDFFTNVSVGSLFGTLLARQFAEMWQRLEAPGAFAIVEQGGHHGEFAADALEALRGFAPECFAAATYWLVEPVAAIGPANELIHAPSSGVAAQDWRACGPAVPIRIEMKLYRWVLTFGAFALNWCDLPDPHGGDSRGTVSNRT